MQTSKKIFRSVAVVILTFIMLSVIVIEPYLNSETAYYQDNELRNMLEGKIDCIVLGSSHGLAAFDTNVLDDSLPCCSYNLSTVRMTLDNKYCILEKELQRNPAKTVILEISYDTLARSESEEFSEGDEIAVSRLETFSERVSYMLRSVQLDDWLNIYSRLFVKGLSYYMDLLQGNTGSAVDYQAKGFLFRDTVDVTMSEERARETYNYRQVTTDYPDENVKKFSALVELCKSYNSRVIVVVTPLSDAIIWRRDNWHSFHNWMLEYCSNNGCEFYDLNLLSNRYSLFSDSTSFYDDCHMSGPGAAECTKAFCEIINKVDAGEDISHLFYSSYEEMKQDSPYAVYLDDSDS